MSQLGHELPFSTPVGHVWNAAERWYIAAADVTRKGLTEAAIEKAT
jgi:hypothetical protein